jgi:uncharacterized protein
VKVDISSIRYTKGGSLQASVSKKFKPFEWAGEEILFQQPVTAELGFTNTGTLILAEGYIKAIIMVACSRCLEPFNLDLQAPFRIGYVGDPIKDLDLAEEDMEIRAFKGKVIDVAPDVEETILLSLPMKFLCRNDCRGMCPQCGQNLNEAACHCKEDYIDPRLATLRDFIK